MSYLISALVVTYNESSRLYQCLSSLNFCQEVLVVDLGSTDNSVEIAESFKNVSVIHHEKVEYVEKVWGNVVRQMKNDWIVRLDPDEELQTQLAENIFSLISSSENLGMIRLPHQYYFCGKRLDTTIWGGIKYIERVFHRERVNIHPHVHRGITVKDNYEIYEISSCDNKCINHYWVDSISQLISKHIRYISGEGVAKYESGDRFLWKNLIADTLKAIKISMIDCRGLFGGYVGIFLSFFYAWYVAMSHLSLRRYQKENG